MREIKWDSTNLFIAKNKCVIKKNHFASLSYNFFNEFLIMEFKNAGSLSKVS